LLYVGGAAVGMGGFRRRFAAEAELKRMYMRPEFRGRGLSRRLLVQPEDSARAAGFERLVLVTGLRRVSAIALCRSAGYVDVFAFGHYADSDQSVYLGRSL